MRVVELFLFILRSDLKRFKIIKKLIKILVIIGLGIFIIPASAFIILQNRQIQSFLANEIASQVSHNLGADFSIESLDMIFFNRVVMKNVMLKDQNLDTLLFCPNMVATLKKFNFPAKNMELSRLKLDYSTVRLAVDSNQILNLTFITEALNKPPDTTRAKWSIGIHTIEFEDSRFLLDYQIKDFNNDRGINFTDLKISELNLLINQLSVQNDTVHFHIERMDFKESSGFSIDRLEADARINKEFLEIRDVHLITERSDIQASMLDFHFKSFKDFGNKKFSRNVKIGFHFSPSVLSLKDLAYFAPDLWGWNKDISLDGKLDGKLSNLKASDMFLGYGSNTRFIGSFNLLGLPNIKETFMYFDIKDFTSDVQDIESIQKPGTGEETVDLSESFYKLGNITYQGKFTGFYNDFVTYGNFSTDLGLVSSDISIKPDSAENVRFQGELKTEGFEFGQLLGFEENAGALSMNGNVKGISFRGGEINANMKGNISSLHMNGYEYQNIDLSGDLSNKTFDGSFEIADPNLKMDFLGKIDFSDSIPVFDFTANVDNANLYSLKLTDTDPSFTLSCFLRANFTGINLDDFDGEIKLVNSLFRKEDKQIQMYDFNLYAQHRPDSNWMTLRSDLIDAGIWGKYHFEDLHDATDRILSHHMPAFSGLASKDTDEQVSVNDFSFSINFKNVMPITDFFYPEVIIAQNSTIRGHYNPDIYQIDLSGFFPELVFRNNKCEQFDIELISNDSMIRLETSTSFFNAGKMIHLEGFNLTGEVSRDTILYGINWDNKSEDLYMGVINGMAVMKKREGNGLPRIDLKFDPGEIYLHDTLWEIAAGNISIDSNAISIEKFKLAHINQLMQVAGKLSKDSTDQLKIDFNQMNLSHLNRATRYYNFELDGILNGTATLSDIYRDFVFLSDIRVEDLTINNELLGDTDIKANWIGSEKKINLLTESLRGELKTLRIYGDYFPGTKKIDFTIGMNKLRLNIIEPYLKKQISDLSGICSGEIRLTGTTRQPQFDGEIQVQKTSFLVNYLQTAYSFSNSVSLINNNLFFKDFSVFDEMGQKAVINGKITSKYLKDLKFDLNLVADNFRFLNTRVVHNSTYYGTAIASGALNLLGSPHDIILNISARTERNTHLFIPINEGSDLQENNFISFINNLSDEQTEDDERESFRTDLSGFRMNFDLEATPDATVEIIFDPKVGDIMKANGSGNIKMEVTSGGVFTMYGEYLVDDKGEYLFTLQNIINKKLKVQKGGSLIWNGDPTGAIINMHAIYNAKASPAVLIPDPPEYLKKRMPIECHLIMTGNLLSPLIKFDIQMPTAEEETKNVIKNAITTEEELTKQFLSLLVINNFSSVQSAGGTGSNSGAGMAGVTASELLSNQLSNWLSQISNDFDIGVNYRPGDEISSDQVEVALSTQILDERVTIHTNVDVTGAQSQATSASSNTNTIAGDFDVEVKITNNGKLRVKAYNHYNHDQLYKTSPYTQGVGFVYREDFNSLGDLGSRYRNVLFGRGKEISDTTGVE